MSDDAGPAEAPTPTVRSVAAGLEHEIPKIKGSRFIATVASVSDRGAVEARLDEVRRRAPDATHHCYAWRLGHGRDDWRYADDGEPSGSAGRPILQEIDGRGLGDVLVVVTRYYGGTKLGTGGLVRAYGGAAAAALDRAEIVERPVTRRLAVRHDYGASGPVQGVLAARGLEPSSADYGRSVRLTLDVPLGDLEALRRELVDATHGAVRFEPPGD